MSLLAKLFSGSRALPEAPGLPLNEHLSLEGTPRHYPRQAANTTVILRGERHSCAEATRVYLALGDALDEGTELIRQSVEAAMATIAGTVMGLYAAVLSRTVPDALGHILIASVIATPAAMAVSLLMVPEDGPSTEAGVEPTHNAAPGSSMEALMRGTVDGAALLVNIIAMLVVLVALVSLLNQLLAATD